ncbi:hypothetical protein GE21DRAFT_1218040 [Neurospora crassa]|nr:hypothetical protein GE21DRAFT_1218040 [Neurospora crassa]
MTHSRHVVIEHDSVIIHASQVNRTFVIDPISSRHQETLPRINKNVHNPKRPIRLLALHHGAILALPSRKTKKNDEGSRNSKLKPKKKKSNVSGGAMQRARSDTGHVGHVSGLCEVPCC